MAQPNSSWPRHGVSAGAATADAGTRASAATRAAAASESARTGHGTRRTRLPSRIRHASTPRMDGRSNAFVRLLDLEISLSSQYSARTHGQRGEDDFRAATGAEQLALHERVAPARPSRDLRRRPDQPGDLRVALRDPRLAAAVGAAGDLHGGHRLPRLRRRPRPQAHPAREPLRRRARADGGRHRRPAARLVLAPQVPPAVLARAHGRRLARPPLRPRRRRPATSSTPSRRWRSTSSASACSCRCSSS